MKRFLAITLLATAIYTTPAFAESSTTTIDGIVIDNSDPAWPEFNWQIAHGAPGIFYWNRVAKCETGRNWQNSGTWSGGLGIYNKKRFGQRGMGTWERWGGEQFGLRPQDATPLQQIVVANRIAMFGWQATYRDWNGNHERVIQATYEKRYSGFNGWACIKNYRNPRMHGKWYIELNPTRFELRRKQYWRNDTQPYLIHEVKLHKKNIPKWARKKYANQPERLK